MRCLGLYFMHFKLLFSLLFFVVFQSAFGMYERIELARMTVEVTNSTQKKYLVSVYNGSGRDEFPIDPKHMVKKDVVITEFMPCDNGNYYRCEVGIIAPSDRTDQLTIDVAYRSCKLHKELGSRLYSHSTGDLEKKKELDNKSFDTMFPQAHDFVTRVNLKGEDLEDSTMELSKSVSLSFSQMSIRSTAQIILQERMSLKEAKAKLPKDAFEQAVDWIEKINSPKLHQLMLAYLKS